MRSITPHPLQSIEWGEFRKKTGIKVIRVNGIIITIHKIPHTPWTIGYIPKGPLPNKKMILELEKIVTVEETGQKHKTHSVHLKHKAHLPLGGQAKDISAGKA